MHWQSMDWDRLLQLPGNFKAYNFSKISFKIIHYLWPGYTVLLRHNKTIQEEYFNEYYSVLYVEVLIQRQLINLLVGVYFSTFLIILIMCSTFWLNSFLISDRINMGVISILALYDQYNESKKGLPSIGYMHVCTI